METTKLTLDKRMWSMFLDFLIICSIWVPILIITSLLLEPTNSVHIVTALYYLVIIILINKDFFNAKSPAKRITGLQVIDTKSGEPANELKCLIRNFTILVWPLEAIFILFSTSRRIGDYLAGTEIKLSEVEKLSTLKSSIKEFQLTNTILTTIISSIVFIVILWMIF